MVEYRSVSAPQRGEIAVIENARAVDGRARSTKASKNITALSYRDLDTVRPRRDRAILDVNDPTEPNFLNARQMLESHRKTFAQVIQPAPPRLTSRLILQLGKVAGMHAARYRFDPCVGTYSN